jgi:hypothetical protein
MRPLLLLRSLVSSTLLALALVVAPRHAQAAPNPSSTPGLATGTASAFDVSPPLRDLAGGAAAQVAGTRLLEPPGDAEPARGPGDADASVQGGVGVLAMPGTIQNFDGPPNLCSCLPPAPSMDVGPDYVFVADNLHCAIYDKNGILLLGPFATHLLWSGFGGNCEVNNAGYPIVIYDQLADRWFISQVSSYSAPFGFCLAVSTTGDPTGSWYRWSFGTGNEYPDTPKWGMWPDAYYAAARTFTNGAALSGQGVWAFERADLLAGVPSPSVISLVVPNNSLAYEFGHGLLPADLDGDTPPPAGSEGLFLGSMDNGGPFGAPQDAITLWKFHADFVTVGNSTFTLAATLPTSAFDSMFPCTPSTRACIPQAGTTAKLDVGSYRQMFQHRVSYRNFGGHQSIVANQSVEASTGIAGIRWYELRQPFATPVIHQQGTYAPGITDGIHRWLGGIAMDNDGNIGLGFSASSASMFPGIRYTGRLATDALGTLPQGEGTILDGGGSQTSTSSRWGEYGTMAVDPEDDCTFWYVNEYYAVTSSSGWRTRVASFRFPSCTSPVGVEEDSARPVGTSLSVVGPSRGRAAMTLTLGGAGERPVRLDLFDVSGRRVRTLVDSRLPAGRYDVGWDATDDAGRAVHAGVYFARLRAGNDEDSGTILLLR